MGLLFDCETLWQNYGFAADIQTVSELFHKAAQDVFHKM